MFQALFFGRVFSRIQRETIETSLRIFLRGQNSPQKDCQLTGSHRDEDDFRFEGSSWCFWLMSLNAVSNFFREDISKFLLLIAYQKSLRLINEPKSGS
jgi:hypothetical protein